MSTNKRTEAFEISIGAPDINLYLALFSLLKTTPLIDTPEKLELSTTYAESLKNFEDIMKETKDEHLTSVYTYYHALFKHELDEFEEYFSDWEANRIY